MNRDSWQFTYRATVLCEAAKTKNAHHAERLQWWENKKTEIVERIKAEGIEIDESLANLTSNSYQRGPTVQVRTDLMADLQECVGKTREHRGKAEEYDAWVQVLSAAGESGFALHNDDWLFFFGNAASATADDDEEDV